MRHIPLAVLAALTLPAAATEPDAIRFLADHCVRCHGAVKAKGDLRVDTLAGDLAAGLPPAKWAEVIDRINTGEMPPKGERKPSAAATAAVVDYLAGKMHEAEATRIARRDRVAFHRLTRDEYAATVRDLLGVPFDAADPGGLPDDPDWRRFERIGSVLSLSPSHVEKYLAAAETVLAEAFPDKPAERFGRRRDAIDLRGGPVRAEMEALGIADKVRVDLWPGSELQGGRIGPGVPLPAAGTYKVRIKLSGLQPPGGRAPHLTYYVSNLDRLLHEQDVIAPEDQPTVIEFTAHLPAGNHNYQLTNDVPGPPNTPRSGRADPRKPFLSLKDGRRPWQIKLTDEDGTPLRPFLILDWVEWEGPLGDPGPTFAQREYLPAGQDPAEVRRALTRFAERAFRRPVSAAEVERHARIVDQELAAGEPFPTAVKTGLVSILCSKDFLYLIEGSVAEDRPRLTDWELASRLSYFLWGTMPDAALFEAARSGTLHRPEVLKGQAARMLRDHRAVRFAEAFPRQWLQLKQVGAFPPDKKLYPDYDAPLERGLVREATGFFREVLEKNLPLREFLDSDWAVLNARVADHYGIPGVVGSDFRRVPLRPGDHRGGLLTTGAVLSLTSDGTRHRPVHRGKWVSEVVFGKSPPPPPANVKAIEPTPPTKPKATVRQKLAAHTADESCAACHRRIDPLGFAFDNYDAIGRWRTEEVVGDGKGGNPKVEARGELPDGRAFAGPEEFKQLLLSDPNRFAAAFVEKLATFALRRAVTAADRPELAKVVARGKAADYRLADLVEALVLSELFRSR